MVGLGRPGGAPTDRQAAIVAHDLTRCRWRMLRRDDHEAARRLLDQSLALYRTLDLPRFVGLLLLSQSDLPSPRNPRYAHKMLAESLNVLSLPPPG